ncbi:heat-inducible transcription repressor HrcA [candidate division KSB1 bacterium]|jgi:heat-inducible transcriptional repressor|nr:heat-inducible transcription repressor HrcA [candidate division KSB1 bacterium]
MSLDELTERERLVFLSIIHGFVKTAEPVGSRYLAKYYNLNLSPSSIRNVMTDLEEKGLIAQPHTSAGRIPTDSGFRKYVNSLTGIAKLSTEERNTIIQRLARFSQDMDLIIEKASEVMSDISSQLGVALAPRFNQGHVEKIDLVPVAEGKLLLVLSIRSGLVKTIMLEINENVPRDLVETTVQILNERLHDLTVDELQSSLFDRFKDIDEKSRSLIEAIGHNTLDLMSTESTRSIHLTGTRFVISQPEFESTDKIGKILELIDRRDLLIRVLGENQKEGVSIVIGEENQEALMKHCSVITTTYRYEDAVGTIGVIGPTRMQYDKVIALVTFMADTLSYFMSKSK